MVFPKWTNRIPLVILLIVIFLGIFIVFALWYWASPRFLEAGYQPKQPIAFSHRLHAGELGLDCRYCHSNVERTAAASIPPTQVCMNCHNIVKRDSPEIQKLYASMEKDRPVEWIKVHNLPDYVYFDHSRHIQSGVGCATCHGRIDQMDVVRQVEPLSMAWCLDCHRDPAKFIRPASEVTTMDWSAGSDADQITLGEQLVAAKHIQTKQDCSTCHR
ncbi:MAG: cytochrome c3 family protein [Candidatus Margulisiibacteriota bacterium]